MYQPQFQDFHDRGNEEPQKIPIKGIVLGTSFLVIFYLGCGLAVFSLGFPISSGALVLLLLTLIFSLIMCMILEKDPIHFITSQPVLMPLHLWLIGIIYLSGILGWSLAWTVFGSVLLSMPCIALGWLSKQKKFKGVNITSKILWENIGRTGFRMIPGLAVCILAGFYWHGDIGRGIMVLGCFGSLIVYFLFRKLRVLLVRWENFPIGAIILSVTVTLAYGTVAPYLPISPIARYGYQLVLLFPFIIWFGMTVFESTPKFELNQLPDTTEDETIIVESHFSNNPLEEEDEFADVEEGTEPEELEEQE